MNQGNLRQKGRHIAVTVWFTWVFMWAGSAIYAQDAPAPPAPAPAATQQVTPAPPPPSTVVPAATQTTITPLPRKPRVQPVAPVSPTAIPGTSIEFRHHAGLASDSARLPYAYFREDALMRFSVWSLGQELLVAPFQLPGGSKRTRITHIFDLQTLPTTDLYLYIIDAGCQVEVELNGRYLGVDQHPMKPFVITLRKEWLQLTGNKVDLWLSWLAPPDFFPDGSLGLMQSAYLLTPSQLARLNHPFMQVAAATGADTIGIVAPFYGPSGFYFDAYYALAALDPLRRFGIRKIYFPFPPSRKMQAFCAQMGFQQVTNIPAQARVCWVNTYPRAQHDARYPAHFWLDKHNRNTAFFGNFIRYENSHIVRNSQQRASPFLVMLVLLPLLILMAIRMVNPGFQQTLWPMFVQPKLFVDVYANNSLGFAGLGMMLALVRVLLNAVTLTLTLRMVQEYQAWDWLNWFFSPSLFNRLIYTDASLAVLFGWSLLVFAGITVVRYVAAWGISTIYNIRDFTGGVIALDILNAFPLAFVLPFLPAMGLFISPEWVGWPVAGYALLLLVYWGRGIYTTYVGLGRLFDVSAGMKILYICGLNLLPYLFWL